MIFSVSCAQPRAVSQPTNACASGTQPRLLDANLRRLRDLHERVHLLPPAHGLHERAPTKLSTAGRRSANLVVCLGAANDVAR
jgi:hypothetical protein